MSVVLLSITYNLAASSCGPRFTLVNKGHSDSVNLRRSVMKIVGIIKYYTLNIVYITRKPNIYAFIFRNATTWMKYINNKWYKLIKSLRNFSIACK